MTDGLAEELHKQYKLTGLDQVKWRAMKDLKVLAIIITRGCFNSFIFVFMV